jgi:folate-dependent phosphoribosylglycinamide formyltransferase PurN
LATLDAGNGRELDVRINMLAITTTNAKIVRLFSNSNVTVAKIRAATAGISHLIVALEKSTEPRVIIVTSTNEI